MKSIRISFLSVLFLSFTFMFLSCSKDEATGLNLSSTKLYFDANSETRSRVINIEPAEGWNFSTSEDSKSWLKVVKENETLYVNVEENTTRSQKEGKITISSGGEKQVIEVIQKSMPASIEVLDKTVKSNVEELVLEVLSNIEYDTEILENPDWITKKSEVITGTNGNKTLKKITYSLTKNTELDDRQVKIMFKEKNGVFSKKITIIQKGAEAERIPNSSITSATDDFHETDNPGAAGWGDGGIDFALDGNFSTKFHSKYDQPLENPINLDINFENVDKMDYITYYPRSGGGGAFTKVEIWYASATQTTLTKLMDFEDFKSDAAYTKIIFPQTVENVKTIRIKVLNCKGNKNAACAELEFYYFK